MHCHNFYISEPQSHVNSCNRYKKQAKARKLLTLEEDYLKKELAAIRQILVHYRDRYENHLISYSVRRHLIACMHACAHNACRPPYDASNICCARVLTFLYTEPHIIRLM